MDRPILFSAPMVLALLAGTKTQTRRVVKRGVYETSIGADRFRPPTCMCPYGQPGDRLWVRETWTWRGGMSKGKQPVGTYTELWVRYAADKADLTINPGGAVPVPKQPPQREGEPYSLLDAPEGFVYSGKNTYVDRLEHWWKRKIPGIHMPRWASRITLEVTSVRVERLQDISEADAVAEGIERLGDGWQRFHVDPDALVGQPFTRNPVLAYRGLWEQINGAGSWDLNPWVWCVAFRRVT